MILLLLRCNACWLRAAQTIYKFATITIGIYERYPHAIPVGRAMQLFPVASNAKPAMSEIKRCTTNKMKYIK